LKPTATFSSRYAAKTKNSGSYFGHVATARGSKANSRNSRANYQPKADGVGHPEFLSEQAWFRSLGIDGDQVDREAPADGVLVDYAFDAQAAAEYELWARIGYEFVRSPFDWRLDGGPWSRCRRRN
jgi:hypothetical protein